jgi:hypothetical protein
MIARNDNNHAPKGSVGYQSASVKTKNLHAQKKGAPYDGTPF